MLLWLPVYLSSIFSITLICVLPSICLFHSWTSTITYLYLWSALIFWLTSTYWFACLLIICLSLAMRPRLVVLECLIVKWKSLKSHPQTVRKCYLGFFLIMVCMSWVLIHKCIFHPNWAYRQFYKNSTRGNWSCHWIHNTVLFLKMVRRSVLSQVTSSFMSPKRNSQRHAVHRMFDHKDNIGFFDNISLYWKVMFINFICSTCIQHHQAWLRNENSRAASSAH